MKYLAIFYPSLFEVCPQGITAPTIRGLLRDVAITETDVVSAGVQVSHSVCVTSAQTCECVCVCVPVCSSVCVCLCAFLCSCVSVHTTVRASQCVCVSLCQALSVCQTSSAIQAGACSQGPGPDRSPLDRAVTRGRDLPTLQPSMPVICIQMGLLWVSAAW